MNLLEELNKINKSNSEDVITESTEITLEAYYLIDGVKYKRTVVVENPEEAKEVAIDFNKRFKDLVEIRVKGANIIFNNEGEPEVVWDENAPKETSANND